MKYAEKSSVGNRLGFQAALFLLGNVFTLLVGFPLQVFVARRLGAGELGLFSLAEGVMSLLVGLLGFGLAPTLVKFIPVYLEQNDFDSIRQLVRKGFVFLLTVGCGAWLLLVLLFPVVADYWPALAGQQQLIAGMGLMIPLGLLIFFLQQGLRGFQEIRYMVLGSAFLQLAIKAAIAVLLIVLGFGLAGYVAAIVVSTLVACIWMGLGLRKKLAGLASAAGSTAATNNNWISYAKTLYGTSLVGLGGDYLDRFMLGLLIGPAPVGILMVVKQLQQLPVIFLQMFLAIAAPMFSSAHARNDTQEREHIYHLTIDWVMRLSAPLFIFFLFFAEPLLRLFGETFFQQGKLALWILVAAQVINLGFGPVGSIMNMGGHERFMLKLVAWEQPLVIVCLLVLVPWYGLTGTAIALAISNVFQNVAAFWVAHTRLGVRWSDRRYLRWLLPLAGSLGTGILLSGYGPAQVSAIFLIVCLVLLYMVFFLLSLLQGLHEDDKELIAHVCAKFGWQGRTWS